MTREERHRREETIHRISRFVGWMEAKWKLPIIGTPFGLDFLIGLIPVVGDVFTGLVSLWLIKQARTFHLPKRVYFKMALNIILDVIFGSVPLVGDLFDLTFRANQRNARLLMQSLEQQKEKTDI